MAVQRSLRFTLIGLSLGGYVAFEIIRRQLQRLERLVLMDTRAIADDPPRRERRLADIAKMNTKSRRTGSTIS